MTVVRNIFSHIVVKEDVFAHHVVQRRALEFGESVTEEIIDDTVPIRSGTFTLPKILRIYFRFDHSLYSKFSQ